MASTPIEEAQELQRMIADYAKQETIDPLKALARYLGLGITGAITLFLGIFFLSLGLIRFIQTLTLWGSAPTDPTTNAADPVPGAASIVPYGAAILVLALVLVVVYLGLTRAKRNVSS